MDKRRNHIIFWVGYYCWYVIGNYSVTYGFRTVNFTIIMTFLTVMISMFTFYFSINYIFPIVLTQKKYFALIIFIIVFGIITLMIYYYTMLILSKYFPYTITDLYIERMTPYFISRYISILYLIFSFWYLKIYRKNLEKEHIMTIQKNLLIKSVNQAELSSLINQINPHFLYNILNFFYAQSLTTSTKLANSILTLSSIMRYSIREKDEEGKVSLEKEIEYIENYATLDNEESNQNAKITFNVNGNLQYRRIKSLTLLPFIELVCKNRERNSKGLIDITIVENKLDISVNYTFKEGITEKVMLSSIKKYREILFKEYGTRFNLFFQSDTLSHLIELKIIL